MNLRVIILKSLRQHLLSTLVTVASTAVAGGLLMFVWVLKDRSHEAFNSVASGFDAVLGVRASKLQLVLNAVFHMDVSPGNLEWEDFEKIRDHPSVALAVPLALGDNYRGYRVVGVSTNLFAGGNGMPAMMKVKAPGRVFDPDRREALVGSFAARQLGLKLGGHFHPYHGLNFDEDHEHASEYIVVGILDPTNTPADKVLWIPLAGLQKMDGHSDHAAEQISAVLIRLGSNSRAGFQLNEQYNREGSRLTFAWPVAGIVAGLFEKIGWFESVLQIIAYLVAMVAVASILASLHNSMNERRKDLAVMRALGAGRKFLFTSVVMESAMIAGMGMLVAFGVHAVLMSLAVGFLRDQTGVVLDPLAFHPVMLWAPLVMVATGAAAGIIPAFKAYRVNVIRHLG